METKDFEATDENMQAVNDFIHSQLPEDCSFGILNKIDLAVEEIYINIAHYAYAPKVGMVQIDCGLENGEQLMVVFKDSGKPFNPLAHDDPDISLSAEEREIGGLGIFLTKQFMDSVKYEYIDGKNILSFKKKLSE